LNVTPLPAGRRNRDAPAVQAAKNGATARQPLNPSFLFKHEVLLEELR
jgi:hypothetical protein